MLIQRFQGQNTTLQSFSLVLQTVPDQGTWTANVYRNTFTGTNSIKFFDPLSIWIAVRPVIVGTNLIFNIISQHSLIFRDDIFTFETFAIEE